MRADKPDVANAKRVVDGDCKRYLLPLMLDTMRFAPTTLATGSSDPT